MILDAEIEWASTLDSQSHCARCVAEAGQINPVAKVATGSRGSKNDRGNLTAGHR